ncbi:MAG: glycosyltransferase [Cyclobacteriaceae bacterium]
MTNGPKVSIIMPVYNGMPYLPLAIDSILNQTFSDFELILINDCSTDGSASYIESIKDRRIVSINNSDNLGITKTLREGINVARGTYIARLDADDIAYPQRIEKQVLFLDKNPRYGLIGTSYRSIDEDGATLGVRAVFTDDLEVRWKMLFKSPFVHSSIMLQKAIIDSNNFNYEHTYAEDYHLWNLIMKYTNACILEEPLLDYRVHNKSWTFTRKSNQVQARLDLSFSLINNILTLAGTKTLSWDRFLDFTEWRRTGVGEINSNSRIEWNILNGFCLAHKKNTQLKDFRKKILSRILNRAKKNALSDLSQLSFLAKAYSNEYLRFFLTA